MRNLRRIDREITRSEAEKLILKGEYGVLSTVGENAQPYGIPLNYTYNNNNIYFHCALDGHKMENILNNPKVSFCVVGETKVIAEKLTTKYESVIIFGHASEIQGYEKEKALVWLLEKYSAEFIEEGKLAIQNKSKVIKVIKIEIDSINGKAHR